MTLRRVTLGETDTSRQNSERPPQLAASSSVIFLFSRRWRQRLIAVSQPPSARDHPSSLDDGARASCDAQKREL